MTVYYYTIRDRGNFLLSKYMVSSDIGLGSSLILHMSFQILNLIFQCWTSGSILGTEQIGTLSLILTR